jgi:hypothetical protein
MALKKAAPSTAMRLKKEIESICWKAGVNPKQVEEIKISPMDLVVTMQEIPVENGVYERVIRTIPYVYEDEPDGDAEAV